MQSEFIIVSEYCVKCDIEPSFIRLLAEEGLIDLRIIEGSERILTSQLPDLERYVRLHYDLSVNIAGIDVIRHLLTRVDELQTEIRLLKRRLSVSSETNEETEDY